MHSSSHGGGRGTHVDVAALALAVAAGDEVVAEVELLVGVLEDGAVPRQCGLRVEAHAYMRRRLQGLVLQGFEAEGSGDGFWAKGGPSIWACPRG